MTRCWPSYWPAEAIEVFIRPEDAERAIEGVRGEDPEMTAKLRINDRELEAR
jgi:hypothetical protein